eukprot:TRINITY_DN6034_c0_g1_i2.p1 TRINITY_DN6034_c0_g1~~TRINITY_DN6034_c0_g1_i2.p1  ORF type:complete len:922 (+),score=327.78 TRINITY_DN6034_c0_g1_i2:125-2767(+)
MDSMTGQDESRMYPTLVHVLESMTIWQPEDNRSKYRQAPRVEDNIVLIDDPFDQRTLRLVLPLLHPAVFYLDRILLALQLGDQTSLLVPGTRPTREQRSLIDILLFSIVYLQLICNSQTKGPKIYAALNLIKNQTLRAPFQSRPTREDYVDGITERLLRFNLIAMLVNDIEEYQGSTIFWNELFEASWLDLAKKKRVHLHKRDQTEDEKNIELKEKLYQQETSFERIGWYLGKSVFVVLAHLRSLSNQKEFVSESIFRQENLNTLIKVIERFTKSPKSIRDVPLELQLKILEFCLSLIATGMQYVYGNETNGFPEWVTPKSKRVSQLLLDLYREPHLQTLQPLLLLFFGASYGFNPPTVDEEIYGLFIQVLNQREMKNSPEVITGLSYLMSGVEDEDLPEVTSLLLAQFPENQNSVPMGTEGFLIFRLFDFVFSSRLLRDFDEKQWIPNLVDTVKRASDHPDLLIVSTFAAAGILEGASQANSSLSTYIEEVEDMISISAKKWHSGIPRNRAILKLGIGLAVVSDPQIVKRYPLQSFAVEVWTEQVLAGDLLFHDLRCQFSETVKKVDAHLQNPLFINYLSDFNEALAEIYEISDESGRDLILRNFIGFSEKIYQQWKIVHSVPGSIDLFKFSELLQPVLETIFVSMTNFFTSIIHLITGKEAIEAIKIFSNMSSFRVNNFDFDELFVILVDILRNSDSATDFLKILPSDLFQDENRDSIEISRTYFLFAILEKLILKFPEQVLPNLLVHLFRGLKSTNVNIVKYCHGMFAALFSSSTFNLKKDTVIQYIEVALQQYPAVTPAVSFQEVLSSICENASSSEEDQSLVIYSLERTKEKAKKSQVEFNLKVENPQVEVEYDIELIKVLVEQMSHVPVSPFST